MIQRQLDLLEFSFNAANSNNHHHVSAAVQIRLDAVTNIVGVNSSACTAIEKLKHCASDFVEVLSACGDHTLFLDAIRADTLAALSQLRMQLETGEATA